MKWLETRILEIHQETADAVSIVFDIKQEFKWLPGQHIQIKLDIDDKEYNRHYSISSAPNKPLQITVKKVKSGEVSSYINNKLKVGDTVQISPAKGKFCHEPNKKHRQSYYCFAAGSGITPIYSIITHILATEPNSFIYLLYGNKNDKTSIFKQTMDLLQQEHPSQFLVEHCHSSPSWFKSSPWHSGRIDENVVTKFIKQNPPYAQNCQYYICGPNDFIPIIAQALQDIDVPNSRIHTEYFGSNSTVKKPSTASATMSVKLRGHSHQVTVLEGQSLLEALKSAKLDVPYSCESGMCGSCQCHLTNGNVDMLNNQVLQDAEVKQGIILTCQSYPTSNSINISYE